MSVVLSILKIIGIILLVILCIILALLLIVLFVPIRYSAHAVKEETGPESKITDGLHAQAGVSWLLHIISFKIAFEGGKLQKGLKIFGIDLSKRKKKKAKKKKRKTAKDGPERPLHEIARAGERKKTAEAEAIAEELLSGEDAESGQEEANTTDTTAAEAAKTNETAEAAESVSKERVTETVPGEDGEISEEENSSGQETEAAEAAEEEQPAALSKEELKKKKREEKEARKAEKARKAEEKRQKRAQRKKADSFKEFLWRVAEAIYNVLRKIGAKIAAVIEKLKALWAVVEKWTDFLEDDRTQTAIALALREVGGILKGLLPKKVKGYVRFGHDDPSKTGQQLAYLAAAYPLYGKNLDIYPDFEQKALEGDIELKGRVFLASIVWAGLKLILNKNIKYVIGFVRNKEDKANGGE